MTKANAAPIKPVPVLQVGRILPLSLSIDGCWGYGLTWVLIVSIDENHDKAVVEIAEGDWDVSWHLSWEAGEEAKGIYIVKGGREIELNYSSGYDALIREEQTEHGTLRFILHEGRKKPFPPRIQQLTKEYCVAEINRLQQSIKKLSRPTKE